MNVLRVSCLEVYRPVKGRQKLIFIYIVAMDNAKLIPSYLQGVAKKYHGVGRDGILE